MSEPGRPEARDGAQALRRSSLRAVLLYSAMALLLVAVVLVVGDEIAHDLRAIDAWIAGLGPWAVFAFVGLFVLATSVFVPETVLSVMAGALFGMVEGLAAVVVGGLAAGTVQFLLSRWALRSRIERTLAARPSLAAVRRAVMGRELRLQTLIRLTPLNPATLNYLLGAAGVRLPGFLLASLAFTPHQAVEVYFGYAGRHVAASAGRGGTAVSLHDGLMVGGLVLSLVAVAWITRVARKAVAEAVVEAGSSARPEDSGS